VLDNPNDMLHFFTPKVFCKTISVTPAAKSKTAMTILF